MFTVHSGQVAGCTVAYSAYDPLDIKLPEMPAIWFSSAVPQSLAAPLPDSQVAGILLQPGGGAPGWGFLPSRRPLQFQLCAMCTAVAVDLHPTCPHHRSLVPPSFLDVVGVAFSTAVGLSVAAFRRLMPLRPDNEGIRCGLFFLTDFDTWSAMSKHILSADKILSAPQLILSGCAAPNMSETVHGTRPPSLAGTLLDHLRAAEAQPCTFVWWKDRGWLYSPPGEGRFGRMMMLGELPAITIRSMCRSFSRVFASAYRDSQGLTCPRSLLRFNNLGFLPYLLEAHTSWKAIPLPFWASQWKFDSLSLTSGFTESAFLQLLWDLLDVWFPPLLAFRKSIKQDQAVQIRSVLSWNLNSWSPQRFTLDPKARVVRAALRRGPVCLQETRWKPGVENAVGHQFAGVSCHSTAAQREEVGVGVSLP